MNINIDFSKPILSPESALALQPTNLNEFYAGAGDFDKSNLFFVLLTSMHHYQDKGDTLRAGHLCFLLAYYLFVPLTPPGSALLALHYIRKAIQYNDLPEYRQWLELIQKGN